MIRRIGTLGVALALALVIQLASVSHVRAAAAKPPVSVDVNTGTLKELQELPGIGPAMAKKIIAGRPYTAPADLLKAGLTQKEVDKVTPLITFGATAPATPTPPAPGKMPASKAEKVDLNTAALAELETLPGIDAATAAKIIANRPYLRVEGLTKAGLTQKDIVKLVPLVDLKMPGKSPIAKSPNGPVNVNTATLKELEELPGVGPVIAKKIVAGRPYTTVAGLSKAGVTPKEIVKLTPLITFIAAETPTASTPSTPVPSTPPPTTPTVTPPMPAPKTALNTSPSTPTTVPSTGGPSNTNPPSTSTPEVPSGTAQTPPHKGMVWVNLDTKVYHKEGDRWYGRTKNGKFMTEADAKAAGYRESWRDERHDERRNDKDSSK
jgi:DNA uptake protein ComE-like DNA-binding protein